MAAEPAAALAALRAFNYERIYTRPDSLAQAAAVIEVLRALVSYYCEHPASMPGEAATQVLDADGVVQAAVTYVAGMTDRFAFETAAGLLGWDPERLPRGIGRGA
jgi:dGTPase